MHVDISMIPLLSANCCSIVGSSHVCSHAIPDYQQVVKHARWKWKTWLSCILAVCSRP